MNRISVGIALVLFAVAGMMISARGETPPPRLKVGVVNLKHCFDPDRILRIQDAEDAYKQFLKELKEEDFEPLESERRALKKYQEIQRQIYNDIRVAITAIGKDKSYDLILKVDEATLGDESIESVPKRINHRPVLFHGEEMDITDAVIKRLNETYKNSRGEDY